jgi:cytochrome oxidase Cu insertion factor (SCO1/SenC/PrrC family)
MIRKLLHAAVGVAVFAALTACSGQEAAVQTAAHAGDHAATASHDGSVDHAAPEGERKSGHGTHDYVMPDVTEMTGEFELVNAKTGGAFTQKDLQGSWTLMYMGYIECLEACPMAMASIPKAVDKLNALGLPTKAVFIDINAPRLDDLSGGVGHTATASGAHDGAHGSSHGGRPGAGDVPVSDLTVTGPEIRRQAIAKWGEKQDPDVILLSGSRKQVMTAGRLFKSRAEQTMMPTKEAIHHINHTTYIYALNPKGDVAVLLYHSDSPQMMVDEVVAVSKAAASPT